MNKRMKRGFIRRSENKKRLLMASKNFIYFKSPHRPNQTSFQSERKRKGESKRGKKRDPISLPLFFSFSFLPSRFLSSTPSCSVFRLSSLREWSTIKDLIKTPEQAKAVWQCARPSPAQTGSASYLAPKQGYGLGFGGGGDEGWE